ncbi:MAG: oxidoreductase [Rhodobacteraceae bacterium]|nr:oxidoreductase [Paracoccaceae bacterium]MAY48186.1 oxidoreductase [Paracoccaceae bacterium]
MTRLLMAGTGMIGQRHMAHIINHPALTLAGVIDPMPDRRPDGIPGFTDIADVDVAADGIVIATPTPTHAPLTLAALQRGWHVLVEKPVAEDLPSAQAMIDAAAQANRQILVGHHRRHHPRVAKLKEIIAGGALGRPVTAALLWTMRKPDAYFDVPWRAGMDGAPVKQNLIHDVDTLRWLFGDVVHVSGFGSNAIRGAARTESGGAVLGFATGMTATIAFADTTPTPWGFEAGTGESPAIPKTGQDFLRIACTRGAVEFPSLRTWSGAQTWNDLPRPTETPVEDAAPLIRQLDHFADVIAGRASPLVSADEAMKTLDVTLQIEAATRPKGDPE